jgi:hypothetical protein
MGKREEKIVSGRLTRGGKLLAESANVEIVENGEETLATLGCDAGVVKPGNLLRIESHDGGSAYDLDVYEVLKPMGTKDTVLAFAIKTKP